MNYEWRQIVASALQFYFRHGQSALALDNEDLLNTLLEDLYTAESFGGMITRINTIALPSSKSTSSASFVAVPDSAFSHTFTKPNAVIRCSNVVARNNTAGLVCEIQIRIDSLAGVESGNANYIGASNESLAIVARFDSIEIGVPKSINLWFRASGATAVINSASHLVFEIEEYD